MKRIGRAWDFFQDKIIENVSRFALFAIILLAFEEVVRRYIFGSTFLWYQDVAVYFTLAAVFLYFAIDLKRGAHIRFSLFVNLLKRRGGKWKKSAELIEVLAYLMGFSFCILFVWYGIEFARIGIEFGRTAENADFLYLWPFYVVLLVGFAFLCTELGRSLYLSVKKLRGKRD